MPYMEVVGDVLGDVDGDVLGEAPHAARRPLLRLQAKPNWRHGQLAPGVMAPDEGMVPMTLTAQAGQGTGGTGTFTSVLSSINWLGRMQKPYRAERFLISVVRTGTTATGRLLGQFFVGVDLQQAAILGFDLELLGAATAFGTRLTLVQAPPGVEITIQVVLSSALTNPDTILAFMGFLGRIIH
ncbi:MAG TPA: hypothetical protein VHP55_11955 [Usitatibacter sp.]|jgi:hypothetical protein|nr:hypothetical protein [Usitatibacter sp.]